MFTALLKIIKYNNAVTIVEGIAMKTSMYHQEKHINFVLPVQLWRKCN